MFLFLFTFVSPAVSGLRYSRLFRNRILTEMVFVRLPPLKNAADQCWACTGVLRGLINGRAYIPRGLKIEIEKAPIEVVMKNTICTY